MIVSMMTVNVGRSAGNLLLCFSFFVRVSLFFVLEPPVQRDGMVVEHEERDLDLISFVIGSGVAVYSRVSDVGMFEVERHFAQGSIVGFAGVGGLVTMAGVYTQPNMSVFDMGEALAVVSSVDIVSGDFNARHPAWSADPHDTVRYPTGVVLKRFIEDQGLVCCPVSGPTFCDVSVLDLTICRVGSVCSHRYVDLASLEHQAQLVRCDVHSPPNLVACGISWKRVD